jgi:hypothetical protein
MELWLPLPNILLQKVKHRCVKSGVVTIKPADQTDGNARYGQMTLHSSHYPTRRRVYLCLLNSQRSKHKLYWNCNSPRHQQQALPSTCPQCGFKYTCASTWWKYSWELLNVCWQLSQQCWNACGNSGTTFLPALSNLHTCNTRSLYVLTHSGQHLYQLRNVPNRTH